MRSMVSYSKAAMERAMNVQEVILRAMAKRITWWQAAEIIGISGRHMRRWREGYEAFGYDGFLRPEPFWLVPQSLLGSRCGRRRLCHQLSRGLSLLTGAGGRVGGIYYFDEEASHGRSTTTLS
jgi:hypothetical protein